uniref:Uncharacterized protein n=1 Tax=Arundo donax TaxID=35708 RepID=A0A0A9C9Z2_ARUDO
MAQTSSPRWSQASLISSYVRQRMNSCS